MEILAPELIGNEATRRYLRTLVDRGTARGSYLFVGPNGVGKRETALAFARALQCTAKPASSPCGRCAPCSEWRKGLRPDTLIIERQTDRTAILLEQVRPSKQSDIPIEETIHHRLQLKPLFARRQIIIIDGADALNTAAANALLKTLEEPHEQTILILISATAEALPPTVVSRCAVVYFTRVATEEIRTLLKERTALPPDRLALIARLGQGSPGRALAFANDPELLNRWLEEIETLFAKLLRSREEPFALSDALLSAQRADARKQAQELLYLLCLILEDTIAASTGVTGLLTLKAHHQSLAKLSRLLAGERLADFGDRLRTLQRQMDHNVTPKSAFDALTNSLAYAPTHEVAPRL